MVLNGEDCVFEQVLDALYKGSVVDLVHHGINELLGVSHPDLEGVVHGVLDVLRQLRLEHGHDLRHVPVSFLELGEAASTGKEDEDEMLHVVCVKVSYV